MASILGLPKVGVRRLWQARVIQLNTKGDPLETVPGPESISTTPPSKLNLRDFEERFPGIIQDGVLDSARLGALLDVDISASKDAKERFGLMWAGKQDAIQALMTPSFATLKPDLENSINWDTAENVFIEGENLEVLKLLQNAYNDQVKLIYIDPPYNTGNDFVYKDDFSDPIKHYLEVTGQVDSEGNKLVANTETSGRKHSNWLTMMYPRLFTGRNLLTQDGAIFVSIDDNEVHNLRALMDDIFGPENFIGQFVWAAGRKNDGKFISTSHEYILAYARNIAFLNENVGEWRSRKLGLDEIYAASKSIWKQSGEDEAAASEALKNWFKGLPDGHPSKNHKHYSRLDASGPYFPDNVAAPDRPETRSHRALVHPITGKPCAVPKNGWRWKDDTLDELVSTGRIVFGPDHTSVPKYRGYLHERETEAPYSVFYQDGRGSSLRLKELLGGKYFDYPKDEFVLQRIVEFASSKDSIVMDFFAGSGTLGHAVELQNAQDEGQRKYVCVTLPELTPEDSEARAGGFETVSDISLARLKKVLQRFDPDHTRGLRVLKVAKSNFKIHESKTNALDLFAQTLEGNLDAKAVATEITLRIGERLDVPWQITSCGGAVAYKVGNSLVVTDLLLTADSINAALDSGVDMLVFLEDAFMGKDDLKANAYFSAKAKNIIMRTF
jgi:adenine-specific DNA-methyltransferase